MFTLPLTVSEYHELVDAKYGHDPATTSGWALYDNRGRIRGWHRHQPGSRQWAHPDDAFAGFVPDTRRRRHLARLGYTVVSHPRRRRTLRAAAPRPRRPHTTAKAPSHDRSCVVAALLPAHIRNHPPATDLENIA